MSNADQVNYATSVKTIADELNSVPAPANEEESQTLFRRVLERNEIELTSTSGRISLVKYIVQWIKQLPPNLDRVGRLVGMTRFYGALTSVGQAFTHINLNDETQMKTMTPIRKELATHFGREVSQKIIEKTKLSDSDRTRQRNINQDATRERKHAQGYNISLPFIARMADRMIDDIKSGDARYQHSIILLAELAMGSRIGENINAAKFTLEDSKTQVYELVKQVGVLKKRKPDRPYSANVRRGGQIGGARRQKHKFPGPGDAIGANSSDEEEEEEEEEDEDSDDDDAKSEAKSNNPLANEAYERKAELIKPILPVVEGRFLLSELAKWRRNHGQVAGRYDPKAVSKYAKQVNKLFKSRYLLDRDGNHRVVSHLLRAIYAVASYTTVGREAFPGLTLSLYIKKVLGHGSMNIGQSYSHILVIDDESKDPQMPPLLRGERAEPAEPAEPREPREAKAAAPEAKEAKAAVERKRNDSSDEEVDEEAKARQRDEGGIDVADGPRRPRQPAQRAEAQIDELKEINSQLRSRIDKLERNQRVIVNMLKTLQEGLQQLVE